MTGAGWWLRLSPARWWPAVNRGLLVVLAGLVLGVLTYLYSLPLSIIVPVVVCLAGGLLAAAVWTVLRGLDPMDDVEQVPPPVPTPSQRIAFADLLGLETQLGSAVDDQERFDDRLRPQLSVLAVELLRQRRGLRWPEQRAEIRTAVAPGVWELLTAPPGAVRGGRSQVERWISDLEAM